MKSIKLFLLAALVMLSTQAFAAQPVTIKLDVDKMTCGMCPLTVKKALRKIDGVSDVSAKYEGDGKGWATVTYDPDKASVEDLTFATEMAGYPSRPIK